MILFMAGFLFYCNRDTPASAPVEIHIDLPDYYPDLPIPPDNPLTDKKVALGKKLFFDPILSRHRDLSCGSCHQPALAFTDGEARSINVGGKPTLRNSPSLLNIAYHPSFFMDGGNPTLESQLIGPIENELEMNLPFSEAIARVASDSDYVGLFYEVFDDGVNPFTLSRAIAAFERSLLSYNSSFDQWYYSKDQNAIPANAIEGFRLFTSERLNCSKCHSLPLFTDFQFRNNGLKSEYSNDPGRGRITLKDEDVGKFKTPSLRNVVLTGPYMHDGSMESLSGVIDHYANGGKDHINKDSLITGFEITITQKKQLIEFLQSLTDTSSYKWWQ